MPYENKRAVKAVEGILEFVFFAYSASPKVNHTIRLCRIICQAIDFLKASRASDEQMHSIFKVIHDSVVQQLGKNSMRLHREVENLYLLTMLAEAGPYYLIPEELLLNYFGIVEDKASRSLTRQNELNHFAITVLLAYVKNERRYSRLRNFVVEHAIEKLKDAKKYINKDTESLLLFLDLICCPYVHGKQKEKMAKVFGLEKQQLAEIRSINAYWFTAWGKNFNLLKALDAKRSREVY